MSNDLQTSRVRCAASMRKLAKSFYLATRVLPRHKREAVEALYAFCRDVDDTADEWTLTRAQRRALLERHRADVHGLEDDHYHSVAAWFPALQSAYRAFGLDRAQLLRLIAGCESDLDGANIQTMAELESYAALVAGSVGRCMLPILGAGDEASLALAERLGIAMQLTNVLRDVREDALKGRNYLPVAEFGATTRSGVMSAVASHARRYYADARALVARLPNDGSRVALLTAAGLYERILDSVEARGFDPEAERAVVGEFAKLRLAIWAMVYVYTGFATIR